MRKVVLVLLFCAISAWLAPSAAQEWYQLESREGKFTVLFPAHPTYAAVPLREGKLTLHRWIFQKENLAYLVSYIDYPPGTMPNLDNLTKGMLDNRTLVSEQRITHGGHAARDVVARDPSGLIVRQRHLTVGERAYIWNYAGDPETETGPDIQRFLDSLMIRP